MATIITNFTQRKKRGMRSRIWCEEMYTRTEHGRCYTVGRAHTRCTEAVYMVPGARRRFWASESDDPRSQFFRKISPDFVGPRIVRIWDFTVSEGWLRAQGSAGRVGCVRCRLSDLHVLWPVDNLCLFACRPSCCCLHNKRTENGSKLIEKDRRRSSLATAA